MQARRTPSRRKKSSHDFTGYASGSNFEIESIAEAGDPYSCRPTASRLATCRQGPVQISRRLVADAVLRRLRDGARAGGPGLEKDGKIKFPNKKVALISSDNPYSKGIYEGLRKNFAAAGWTVTDAELVPFGEINDWHAFLAKVRQDPPDILINTDYFPPTRQPS